MSSVRGLNKSVKSVKYKYDYEGMLEKLKNHFRACHGYEPNDWLGDDWQRRTIRIDYLEWVIVHKREHNEWSDYYDNYEAYIYYHDIKNLSNSNKYVEERKVLFALADFSDEDLEDWIDGLVRKTHKS